MFDFDITKESFEEKMAEKKAKNEVTSMMIDFMTKMMLESDMPEHKKMSIRVLTKAKDIHKVIEELIIVKYTVPGKEANTETLNKVLEYLELVEVGIKQFVETTPFVEASEDELHG